jgi:hypothetical protein
MTSINLHAFVHQLADIPAAIGATNLGKYEAPESVIMPATAPPPVGLSQ